LTASWSLTWTATATATWPWATANERETELLERLVATRQGSDDDAQGHVAVAVAANLNDNVKRGAVNVN